MAQKEKEFAIPEESKLGRYRQIKLQKTETGEIEVNQAKLNEGMRNYESLIGRKTHTTFFNDDLTGTVKKRGGYERALFNAFKRAYEAKNYPPGEKSGTIKVNLNELVGETFMAAQALMNSEMQKPLPELRGSGSKEFKSQLLNWDHQPADKIAAISSFLSTVEEVFARASASKPG